MNENNVRVYRYLGGYAWRWQLALRIHLDPLVDSLVDPHGGDPIVRDAVQYLERRRAHLAAGGKAGATFESAEDIDIGLTLERDWDQVRRLRLMVLAGVDSTEIASLLGVPRRSIELWEQLFFDAREMRTATMWIEQYLIWPACDDCDWEYADQIRQALAGRHGLRRELPDPSESIT